MKKFLSLVLAALMMLSIGTVAFAHENVDNTFDNYTPKAGEVAPDNWYDPFCYDADGHILPAIMPYYEISAVAVFCRVHNKVFTVAAQPLPNSDRYYYPYETEKFIDPNNQDLGTFPTNYCPYCGDIADGLVGSSYTKTHTGISGVYYGYYCAGCNGFNAGSRKEALDSKQHCRHCYETYPVDKFYRFVPKEYLNDPAISVIFTETAEDFGDGKDLYAEDLVFNDMGFCTGYKEGKSDYEELSFWEKIVLFFKSIGEWFKNLFTFNF